MTRSRNKKQARRTVLLSTSVLDRYDVTRNGLRLASSERGIHVLRRRSLRVIIGVILISGFSPVAESVLGPATKAAAATCGTLQNLQEGYASNFWTGSQPETVEGAAVVLNNPGGFVLCSGNANGGQNFVTAWSMVVSNDLNGYAQSGEMYRYGYTCVKNWAEQKQDVSHTFVDYYLGGCNNVGGASHKFWQQMVLISGSYYVRSNMDSTIIHQSSWFPFAGWTTPLFVQFDAEAYYAQTQIPGIATSPQDWSSLQVQSFADDSWADMCGHHNLGAVNQNSPFWQELVLSCDHFHTWTS